MQTAEAFDKEKLEVKALLASGIFNRAPNLAHLLKYVCEKYFDGAADEIKEYNIAVEALGRRPEFDQKRDSIVRVEAHRLRKRLREYYENEGSGHELHIDIPAGQYTPRFIVVKSSDPLPQESQALEPALVENTAPPLESALELIPAIQEAPTVSFPPARSRSVWPQVLIALALIGGAGIFLLARNSRASARSSAEVLPASRPGDEIRILCGVETGSYTDAFERVWQNDRYYTGGYPMSAPPNHIILGTRDQQIYRNRRQGNFTYDIPLKPGVYELRLHFAETMFGENNAAGGAEAARLFEVRLNGATIESYFDVIADSGGASTADIKVFRDVAPAADGKVHLEFNANTNPSFLNAIEIVPGLPGRIRPYRIAARDRGLTDSQGRKWDPDHYAHGGQIIARPTLNVAAAEPELFRSERFGNLTYSLPVATNGKYTVNLYFTEGWFGPGFPGGGGIGSRTFDILINGVMLRKNFDIFRESGGSGRAVLLSEHGVEPNHQGNIVISLAPNQNYACINALEVLDESH
jgi:hypothetical protein